MQHDTVSIILLAAAMHASWNILIKRAGQRIPYASQWVAIYCGIIAICVLPFLNFPDAVSWPYLCASALLQTAYFFLLAKAYQHGDFSVAYPLMRGTAPLLVLVLTCITPLGAAHAQTQASAQSTMDLLADKDAWELDDTAQFLSNGKLQLKAAQAQQPERFLSDRQQWFAIGGAVALLGFILGALARGKRRAKHVWAD